MAKIKSESREYTIPPNVAQEGYVLQGRVRIRMLADAIVIALPLLIGALMVDWSFEQRIFVFGLTGMPLVMVALIGINGDPLSVFLRNALRWKTKKKEGVQLYNPEPTPLFQSPLEHMMREVQPMDKLVGAYEEHQKKQLEKKLSKEYIVGETFEFAEDLNLAKYKNLPRNPEGVPVFSFGDDNEDELLQFVMESEGYDGNSSEQ